MRRIPQRISYVLFGGAAALAMCVFAQSADAQFMRGRVSPFAFHRPTFRPPVQPPQTNVVRGAFNPSTGNFVPSPTGPFLLGSPRAFEAMRGTFTPAPFGNFAIRTNLAVNPGNGRFTPTPNGEFALQVRGNFAPSAGSFTNSAVGSFNARTGAFVPGPNGAFTLSTRGGFVQSNGTFTPSPIGNFVLTTKQKFDPANGTFVPAADGTFVAMTRGTFTPAPAFAQSAGIPNTAALGSSANGSNVAAVNPNLLSPFNNLTPFVLPSPAQMANPYMASPYGFYSPYGASGYAQQSYAPPLNYGSGYGNNYGAGYGTNYGSQNYQQPQTPAYTPATPAAKQPTALDALGIATDNGAIAWPLAFRLMSPDQRRELLEPAEAQLNAAAQQAVQGAANPRIVDEARVSVAKLRQWLRPRKLDLAESTYADANRLLARIDDALDAMKAAKY